MQGRETLLLFGSSSASVLFSIETLMEENEYVVAES